MANMEIKQIILAKFAMLFVILVMEVLLIIVYLAKLEDTY